MTIVFWDKNKMIKVLNILSQYLINYDPDFFTNAVNKKYFADNLKEIANYIKGSENDDKQK